MKKIMLFMLLGLISSCSNKSQQQNEEELECLCPHATIYLQPYEDFSKEEAEKLVPVLQEKFDTWIYGGWEFKVLNPKKLPKESFVTSRNRYRAMTIMKSELKNLKGEEIIIGLTHKDICANAHGVQDYGIVGMSLKRHQVCVVSDKRLSNKSDYWKPILHEFIHTFYGVGHCLDDDPKCIMKDAKGKGTFHIQEYLCEKCRQ